MAGMTVDWDEAALKDLLDSIEGPVGMLIAELSARAAIVAVSVVHVLPGTPRSGYWGPRSTAVRPRGTTKASIRPHGPVRGSRGGLYGGVNADADPSIFLEMPASQMYEAYPFLTTGLWSLEGAV